MPSYTSFHVGMWSSRGTTGTTGWLAWETCPRLPSSSGPIRTCQASAAVTSVAHATADILQPCVLPFMLFYGTRDGWQTLQYTV